MRLEARPYLDSQLEKHTRPKLARSQTKLRGLLSRCKRQAEMTNACRDLQAQFPQSVEKFQRLFTSAV